jgi:uncharacterized phage protein gp47/JayE
MFDENGNLTINTLDENQKLLQDKYKGTFGLVDIAPTSALGNDLAITAEIKKIADENIQEAFIQNSPYEAIDKGLENLCFLRGIKKKIDEHSIVLVKFSGPDGTVIEKGTIVKNTLTDEEFTTNERGVIAGGTFSVYATAVNSGRVVCDAGTITTVDIQDVTVTNPYDGIVGFDVESNTDLRKRLLAYDNSLNIDEDIQLKLLNLQNVKFVNIESNKTLTVDANGIPAKSTSVVVLGGDEKSIAKTIFKSGIADRNLVGNTQEVVVSDISNKEYVVNFSRPEPISLTVKVTITKNSKFDPNDVGVIKQSILDFFQYKFKIANDVLIDSLYIPVQQDFNNNNSFFKGIETIDIKINDAYDNIPILYNQYAVLGNQDLIIMVIE